MQDIDFDELDRAVSSASAPKTAPVADASVSESVAVTTNSSPAAAPAPTPPAARRSSGRFMDVVHPSSDMRSAPVPERSRPREPEAPAVPERPSTDWPDPLDFHGFTGDEPEKTADTPSDVSVPESAAPLESPFLSDAKVEKRPLGAFSSAEMPAVPPADTSEQSLLEAPDEELLTSTTAETPVVETPTPEPAPEETPTEEVPQPVVSSTPEPVPAPEPTGPTSITQQYKEQPSTSDQPSGAIFDTETYHQPLSHTPKKKSGALVIIWILALILVGAGAGAAVYFFVLPLL